MNKIKQKRRTLKNRGYAASCRNKRDKEEESLKIDLDNLRRDIADIQRRSSEKRRFLILSKDLTSLSYISHILK